MRTEDSPAARFFWQGKAGILLEPASRALRDGLGRGLDSFGPIVPQMRKLRVRKGNLPRARKQVADFPHRIAAEELGGDLVLSF